MGEWRLSADILNNNFTADTNYIQVRTVDKAADMGNFEAIDDSSDNVTSSLQLYSVEDHKGQCRT